MSCIFFWEHKWGKWTLDQTKNITNIDFVTQKETVKSIHNIQKRQCEKCGLLEHKNDKIMSV